MPLTRNRRRDRRAAPRGIEPLDFVLLILLVALGFLGLRFTTVMSSVGVSCVEQIGIYGYVSEGPWKGLTLWRAVGYTLLLAAVMTCLLMMLDKHDAKQDRSRGSITTSIFRFGLLCGFIALYVGSRLFDPVTARVPDGTMYVPYVDGLTDYQLSLGIDPWDARLESVAKGCVFLSSDGQRGQIALRALPNPYNNIDITLDDLVGRRGRLYERLLDAQVYRDMTERELSYFYRQKTKPYWVGMRTDAFHAYAAEYEGIDCVAIEAGGDYCWYFAY